MLDSIALLETPLFLLNKSNRMLYGLFLPCRSGFNVVPNAWNPKHHRESPFPHQVQVLRSLAFPSLSERKYKSILTPAKSTSVKLDETYLSKEQVTELLEVFCSDAVFLPDPLPQGVLVQPSSLTQGEEELKTKQFSVTAAQTLLNGKRVVFIGDDNTRNMYKDIVRLLQQDGLLDDTALRSWGEPSFDADKLLEGTADPFSAEYRECRRYNLGDRPEVKTDGQEVDVSKTETSTEVSAPPAATNSDPGAPAEGEVDLASQEGNDASAAVSAASGLPAETTGGDSDNDLDEVAYSDIEDEDEEEPDAQEVPKAAVAPEKLSGSLEFKYITRAYNKYVEELVQQVSEEAPDVLVVGSCLWDLHKYDGDQLRALEHYSKDIATLASVLKEADWGGAVIWHTARPVNPMCRLRPSEISFMNCAAPGAGTSSLTKEEEPDSRKCSSTLMKEEENESQSLRSNKSSTTSSKGKEGAHADITDAKSADDALFLSSMYSSHANNNAPGVEIPAANGSAAETMAKHNISVLDTWACGSRLPDPVEDGMYWSGTTHRTVSQHLLHLISKLYNA